jgi:hypothetical protein
MAERRKTPRTRALIAGSVKAGFGRGMECTIRNMSDDGACLVFAHRRTALPDDFTLAVAPADIGRSCRLVWQSPYRVGVRFVTGC